MPGFSNYHTLSVVNSTVMDLNNLFFVCRTTDMKVTAVTDIPFYGDPNYYCEEATPRQVAEATKENTRLKIIRH
jgi:hypothetical protein